MKYLVTGGLGFIGSYLCPIILKSGESLTIIDDLSNNVVDPDDSSLFGANVIVNNILNISPSIVSDFDVIIHLASPLGTVKILEKAGEVAKEILDGVCWAINVAKKNKSRLVLASTCEVYGNSRDAVQLDEYYEKRFDSIYSVRNEYSIGKLLSEVIVNNEFMSNNIGSFGIIRPFNVVGKRQQLDGGHVVPRFLFQATSNLDITVYGDGTQKRSFTWVADAANAIYQIAISNKNGIWNIGNYNNQISIIDLANKVKTISNSKSKIVFVNPKEIHGDLFEDAPEKIPNADRLLSDFNWMPTKNVDEIIMECLS